MENSNNQKQNPAQQFLYNTLTSLEKGESPLDLQEGVVYLFTTAGICSLTVYDNNPIRMNHNKTTTIVKIPKLVPRFLPVQGSPYVLYYKEKGRTTPPVILPMVYTGVEMETDETTSLEIFFNVIPYKE